MVVYIYKYLPINDFAHIAWEDTPDFPKPPRKKQIPLVKFPRYLPGVFWVRFLNQSTGRNPRPTKMPNQLKSGYHLNARLHPANRDCFRIPKTITILPPNPEKNIKEKKVLSISNHSWEASPSSTR